MAILDFIEGPAEVTRMIKKCITSEMTPDGLLSDVETFVPSYRMDEILDEPLIWLFEHETTSAEGKSGSLSGKLLLATPYEFVCVVYDDDDIEEAEIDSKKLACRIAVCVGNNLRRLNENKDIVLNNIKFDALYPVGTVSVQGKSEKAPATSIRLIVEYYVDWSMCCKKKIKGD